MKYTLLLLLIAISCVSSSPTNKVQMEAEVETYNEKLSSWKISHKPLPKEMMKLTVAIRIEDDVVAKLEKELYELSDPRHVRYGKHKTVDEITALLNVPASRYQKVQQFFIKNGVK